MKWLPMVEFALVCALIVGIVTGFAVTLHTHRHQQFYDASGNAVKRTD